MPQNLSEILREDVLRAPSGLPAKAVATAVGCNYYSLMADLAGQNARKVSVNLLVPLMLTTGSCRALDAAAQALGGVFVRVPAAVPVPVAQVPAAPAASHGDLLQGLLATVKEFGEFAAESAADIADGKLPPDQLARIRKEGQECLTAIVTFLELARIAHEEQMR